MKNTNQKSEAAINNLKRRNKKNKFDTKTQNNSYNDEKGQGIMGWFSLRMEKKIRVFRNLTILVSLIFIIILSGFSVLSYILNSRGQANASNGINPIQKAIQSVIHSQQPSNNPQSVNNHVYGN